MVFTGNASEHGRRNSLTPEHHPPGAAHVGRFSDGEVTVEISKRACA
jgi:phosphoribosylpyrophosphate synthetase